MIECRKVLAVVVSSGMLAATVFGQTDAPATVRVHGAVTLGKLLTEAQKDVEAKTGLKLEITGNGSGRGLADLTSGAADIAMIGGSLKGVADAANKEKANSVNVEGMIETTVVTVPVAIVTHPDVGVTSLTDAQLLGLFTGKITSWKDVGGADVPVKVVLPAFGDGVRISIQEALLKDNTYAAGAVVRNSAKDVPPAVAQLPGAISMLSVKNVEGKIATVKTETAFVMHLSFVTKGQAAGAAAKIIEAAKAAIK